METGRIVDPTPFVARWVRFPGCPTNDKIGGEGNLVRSRVRRRLAPRSVDGILLRGARPRETMKPCRFHRWTLSPAPRCIDCGVLLHSYAVVPRQQRIAMAMWMVMRKIHLWEQHEILGA